MKNITLFFALWVLTQVTGRAQNSSYLKYCPDTNQIKLIDKEVLHGLVQQSAAEVSLVLIYTNDCGGTPYALTAVKELKENYKDQLQLILCSSEDERHMIEMAKIVMSYEAPVDVAYVIDSRKYKSKKTDSRVKGFRFRLDVCPACKKDIIGVPYFILFDKSLSILTAGYLQKSDLSQTIDKKLRGRN